MAGLGSENWSEIRQLRASESLGLAAGPLQQSLVGSSGPQPSDRWLWGVHLWACSSSLVLSSP